MSLRHRLVLSVVLVLAARSGSAQIIGAPPDGRSYGRSQWILNNIGPRDRSGLGARNYATGPAGAEELMGHLADRTHARLMRQLRYDHAAGTLAVERQNAALQAVADGRARPELAYPPMDVSPILADRATAAQPERRDEALVYFRQRAAQFHAVESAARLPAGDLSLSCAFLVDALYRVGQQIKPTAHQRDLFRATCILDAAKQEAVNGPATPQARAQAGETAGTIGAALLAEAQQDPAGAAAQANQVFQDFFGQPIAAVPADAFVCTAAVDQPPRNCALIQQQVAARLGTIIGNPAQR